MKKKTRNKSLSWSDIKYLALIGLMFVGILGLIAFGVALAILRFGAYVKFLFES